MTNIRELIGLFKITQSPATYISKPGALVVNESTGLVYVHDGVTPGGTQISGSGSGTINIPVTTTYTSSGAIATTDLFSLINSASAIAMTLASGSADGQPFTINNLGAGTATVTLNLQGVAATPFSLPTGSALTIRWNVAHSTWLQA